MAVDVDGFRFCDSDELSFAICCSHVESSRNHLPSIVSMNGGVFDVEE